MTTNNQQDLKQVPKMLILADKEVKETSLGKLWRKSLQKVGVWLDVNAIPLLVAGAAVNTYALLKTGDAMAIGFEILYFLAFAYRLYLILTRKKEIGSVSDAQTGQTLALAYVRVEHNNQLTQMKVTDENGRFFFLLPAGKYTLHISRMGYAPDAKTFIVSKNKNIRPVNLDFKLTKLNPAG